MFYIRDFLWHSSTFCQGQDGFCQDIDGGEGFGVGISSSAHFYNQRTGAEILIESLGP